jgi:SpoVK/Ycf46/Vps4 family AAA+-type ATPase
VLFFDEADALFAKRTEERDSRDRHANADTSYLLQLIEGGFDGVAILATNRKTDIDPAFQRRIRYVFDFPRPSAVARTRIWTRAAEALSPERAAALAPIWEPLGAALDVTGAQIKTTLVAAHFAALRSGSPMTAEDVVRAAERELAKEGRTLGARERERIRAHA